MNLTACGGSDDDEIIDIKNNDDSIVVLDGGKKLVSVIRNEGRLYDVYNFSYDKEGKLSEYTWGNYNYSIEYIGNSIIEPLYGSSNSYSYTLNNGRISNIEGKYYESDGELYSIGYVTNTYNSDGRITTRWLENESYRKDWPTKISHYSDTLTWDKNKLLTHIHRDEATTVDYRIATYSYDNAPTGYKGWSPLNLVIGGLNAESYFLATISAHPELLGLDGCALPTKVVTNYYNIYGNYETVTAKYSYTFYEDGYIKEAIVDHRSSEYSEFDYIDTYIYIGE